LKFYENFEIFGTFENFIILNFLKSYEFFESFEIL
jgi:hypothetical protein